MPEPIVAPGLPRCARNVVYGAERGTRTPTSFLSSADFKLSRLAGVSRAGARRRNPERSRRIPWISVGAERGTRTPTPLLKAADFKLRRLAGVSEAGACCRNPERSAAESKDPENASLSTIVTKGIPLYARNVFKSWCREGDSNPHASFEGCGF